MRTSSHARARVRSHEQLVVWRKAIQLTVQTYRLSAKLPDSERFGLMSQMRRAAVSVAANIADGHGREGRQDYIRMLGLARGSLAQLETYFAVVCALEFLIPGDLVDARSLCDEIGRMLVAIQRTLRRLSAESRP
jgi:four helix bundle protein